MTFIQANKTIFLEGGSLTLNFVWNIFVTVKFVFLNFTSFANSCILIGKGKKEKAC